MRALFALPFHRICTIRLGKTRTVQHKHLAGEAVGKVPGGDVKFVFDLDGTLTKEETLPKIAAHFGVESDIAQLTQETVRGDVPFSESFRKRVDILKAFSVKAIDDLLATTPLQDSVVDFIAAHQRDCMIATGNLDVWINSLAGKVGCTVHSSTAEVSGDTVTGIAKVLRKDEIVRDLKAKGEFVVVIGDGNNDSEAMNLADLSIAVGVVHEPAQSVLAVCDFLVYSEEALLRLLRQIAREPEPDAETLVLSCAGIGSRLGLNTTKALLSFDSKPLIEWHLRNFQDVRDVRIVVGFQATEVIAAARRLTNDVCFVFNHEYGTTSTGHSLYLGARFAHDIVLAWDGDLIVHKDDLSACLNGAADETGEFLGISPAVTSDGVYVHLDEEDNVIRFSRSDVSSYEWCGPARLKASRIYPNDGNIFEMLVEQLPLKAKRIRAFDIDTPSDYEYAVAEFATYVSSH